MQDTFNSRSRRAQVFINKVNEPLSVEFPSAGLVGWRAAAKRLLDIVAAGLGLILLAPVLAVIALLIQWDSPGPVMFRQRRVGRHGRHFTMLKFRTMVVGAEKQRDSLLYMNEADGPVFKIRHDPRVTRVGRWLRKATLDELPQLFHVLTGEMSLVGPRPLYHREVDLTDERQRKRLRVKPGITCLWQIERKHHSFDDWMVKDGYYVDHQSLWLDLCILVRTVYAVVRCVGAF